MDREETSGKTRSINLVDNIGKVSVYSQSRSLRVNGCSSGFYRFNSIQSATRQTDTDMPKALVFLNDHHYDSGWSKAEHGVAYDRTAV
jgi:hypothetical protein